MSVQRRAREEWLSQWGIDDDPAAAIGDPALAGVVRHVQAAAPRRPLVVAVAGSVAVGKSVLADALAALARSDGARVEVVGTDGFLLPNAELESRGILMRKGFPESYDTGALVRFVEHVQAGRGEAEIPVYSHEIFDIAGTRTIPAADLVIVEGVNALQPQIAAAVGHRLYVDADEEAIIGWFTERFLHLTALAEVDEGSFYRRFVPLDLEGRAAVARQVWDAINGPNLHEHILATRDVADTVILKRADHLVDAVITQELP